MFSHGSGAGPGRLSLFQRADRVRDQEEEHPDHHAGVCHVENVRPDAVTEDRDVEIKEIDHPAVEEFRRRRREMGEEDAVDHVRQPAAEDQRERRGGELVGRFEILHEIDHDDRKEDRGGDHEDPAPRAAHLAERRALVEDIGDLEELPEHRDLIAHVHITAHEVLGQLVDDRHQHRDAGAEDRRAHRMFSRQRMQRNPPSSVALPSFTTLQQRSHLQPSASDTSTATPPSPLKAFSGA